MAVKTKKTFPNAVGANGQSSTVFTPVEIQLNNQDDLDVYVTLSGGTRVLQLRQSTGSTAQSSHPQVNDTTGLYFPAVSAGTTLYNYSLSTDNNTITFSTALPNGAVVSIERRTRDADSTYTSFASGSTIRATDLNSSSTESNFTAQEARNKAFELEGRLFGGEAVSSSFIESADIIDGTIVDADINNNAEIAVSKLANGSARQILQTAANGTDVEFTSNVDVPGTLDVTGDATLDSNLTVNGSADIDTNLNVDGTCTVDGASTFASTVGIGGQTTINAHLDVNAGASVNDVQIGVAGNNEITTASGNLELDSASGTTRVDDDLVVTGTFSAGSVDATTLESLGSGQFLRSDADDVSTANSYTFNGANPSSTFNSAKLQGKDLEIRFGTGNFNNTASTMTIKSERGGISDGQGNPSALNRINLGHGNLGLPGSATELNSNVSGHVANISLGRMYMDMNGANGSSFHTIMRAAHPDGLMFYHPTTTMINGSFTSGGALGGPYENNTYAENITDARNAADMRIISGGILAKNKVEIGSSTVTGTLQISGTNVTATANELNKLDGYTGTTTELNKLDGFTGSTADLEEVVTGKNVVETITGSATDAQLPTAQAVNERIVELVTEVGGFHPIANETSFPTTNPDINDGAGTIVSLKALTSAFSTGSGVTTHTFTNGAGAGNNVIINGLPASTTFQAGKGLLLETTSTLHTYNYHRLVLDESGVSNADALVNNFNERYYGPHSANQATRPSGANRLNGDLYFNTTDGKMKVFNGSHATGTWDDVAAPGNFFINTLSSSGSSSDTPPGGSATFNGTARKFTLSNPPLTAQQLLVSVNGVIQKPNSGTSPSEGFAINGGDIIFASAPAANAPHFIVTIGSSVNIGTPSNDTVGAAQIIDGSISNAEISSSAAIAKSKIETFVNTNADNRVITGSGTANTLNGEADFTYDGDNCIISRGGNSVAGLTVKNINNSQANAVSQISIEGGDNSYAALQLETNGQSHKLYQLNTGDLGLEKSGVTRITLDANGNVGIGTTSPSTALHINTGAAGLPKLRLQHTGTGNDVFEITSGLTGVSNGGFGIYDVDESAYRLAIDSSGKVGIGISSPGQLLHLSRSSTTAYDATATANDSTLMVQNTGAAGHATIEMQVKSSGTTQTGQATIGAFTEAASSRATSLTFGTRNASSAMEERMRINSSGAVGIGTTTPYYPLEVKAATNAYITTERATKAGGQVGIQIRGASGGKDWYLYQHTNSNTLQLYNNTDGNLIAFNENGMSFGYSGDGIDFSNASPSGSGTVASSLLDDYEEGTFSPILRAHGNTTGQVTGGGRYTKIGNLVHCNIDFEGVNASGIPDATVTEVTGIPFTILNASDNATATTLMSYNVYNANRTNPTFYASGNTTSLFSIYSVSGGAWQHWPTNDINQSTIYLNFSISFFTAT